jgi:hypothetical protein
VPIEEEAGTKARGRDEARRRGEALWASFRRAFSALSRRARPYAPALIACGAVAAAGGHAIIADAGRLAVPLDDAFIHLQYARRLAEGGFFSYVAGEGYTTGATSLLWPMILAPFYLVGVRGLWLILVCWTLGALAHAGVTVEVARLSSRLAGRTAGFGAGAMCVVFGAFPWFALSGMETLPFAWVLLRTARCAANLASRREGAPPNDSVRSGAHGERVEIVALGVIAPLLRPEGFVASLLAAFALARRPKEPGLRSRLLAIAPLCAPLIPPALNLALAGHATSSTAAVKWLPMNPYYSGSRLANAVLDNAELLLRSLLYGEDWTGLFLPEGSNVPILLGFPALFFAARRRRAPYHAAFVAVIALGALLPCSYLSFLWNRVRYLWPFAGAWFVLLACFAREASDALRRLRPSLTFMTPLFCGVFVGALLTRLPWAIHDLAQSSGAIDRQQVALARWAAGNLPSSARIGVNDTGAIAYLSGRATFDVVGLTTEGEARYWIAGAGSRFEHYERMDRDRLPTHFIIYPGWFGCPAVLGEALTEATVNDRSILGGATMTAYEARYDALGSGARPVAAPPGSALIDELDVADLESEEGHGYALGSAWDHENQAWFSPAPELARPEGTEADPEARSSPRPLLADGGRVNRARDAFRMKLPAGRRAVLVMRVAAEEALTLSVAVSGREAGSVDVPLGVWVERALELPGDPSSAPGDVTIEVTEKSGLRFASFHYWLYAR